MLFGVGIVLITLGLLGIGAATLYYIIDTGHGAADMMGAAMMFDDVMLPSLLILTAGIVLAQGMRWWWAGILFAVFYLAIAMGYKFMLIYLLDWRHK